MICLNLWILQFFRKFNQLNRNQLKSIHQSILLVSRHRRARAHCEKNHHLMLKIIFSIQVHSMVMEFRWKKQHIIVYSESYHSNAVLQVLFPMNVMCPILLNKRANMWDDDVILWMWHNFQFCQVENYVWEIVADGLLNSPMINISGK